MSKFRVPLVSFITGVLGTIVVSYNFGDNLIQNEAAVDDGALST